MPSLRHRSTCRFNVTISVYRFVLEPGVYSKGTIYSEVGCLWNGHLKYRILRNSYKTEPNGPRDHHNQVGLLNFRSHVYTVKYRWTKFGFMPCVSGQ
jgi:hypothetical protein